MVEQKQLSGISRRGLLKAAGWAAGTLVAAPLLSAPKSATANAGFPSSTSRRLKVGLLLPASNVYPALGDSLTVGFELGLGAGADRAAGSTIQVLAREVGFGSSLAQRQARQLLETDRVDLVAGAVSSSVAASLRDLFHEFRTNLLVCNIGADVIRSDERSPYIFYHSLGYWQSAWAMGTWAAANLGKRAFVASSFYDSGYDALYAFRAGLEAGGGQIVHTAVTHMPTGGDGLETALAAAASARPDFVYANYCGQPAVDFVTAYAASGLARKTPLAGSGFLVDEQRLAVLGKSARGIKTCHPWTRSLDTPENQAFVAAFHQQVGRQPDAFALLGYDTARLILSAAGTLQGDAPDAAALGAALGSAEFSSPRGRVRMDPRTQSATMPLYLRQVRRRGRTYGNTVVSEVDPGGRIGQQGQAMQLGPKTGWLNAYLSV